MNHTDPLKMVSLPPEEWELLCNGEAAYSDNAPAMLSAAVLREDRLRRRIEELEALTAQSAAANEAGEREALRKMLVSITPQPMKEKHPFDFKLADECEREKHLAEVKGWNACRRAVMDAADSAFRAALPAAQPTAKDEQQAKEQDAERFVFEHTNHGAMIEIELKAMQGGVKSIDWWRAQIDKYMDGAVANEGKQSKPQQAKEPTDREAALCDLRYVAGFHDGWRAGEAGDEAALAAANRMTPEALRVLTQAKPQQSNNGPSSTACDDQLRNEGVAL